MGLGTGDMRGRCSRLAAAPLSLCSYLLRLLRSRRTGRCRICSISAV